MNPSTREDAAPRRALIMAGGGLKVAYQAGVLQVWLDEAKIDFEMADGASGGVFNLAMWCQGMTGTQIADNWRSYRPLRAAAPNIRGLLHGPFATSLFTLHGVKRRVLPEFGLDWHAIRSTSRRATFNLFNVGRQEHRVLPPAQMTDDLLLSAIALPMWFPPVRVDGDTYIDAVFATDANLEEAIQGGATELWVIWTVSTRGRWCPGFVAEYFLMIEAMANSQLRAVLNRIERSNTALDAGMPGEFGHRVQVHLLAAEVPVHYLLNIRRARMARAVDLGVQEARAWCARRGIPVTPQPPRPPASAPDAVKFHEVMAGTVSVDTAPGGRAVRLALELDIVVRDTARFAADPEHLATVHGTVRCTALGGRLPIQQGTFNVLADASPGEKRMVYDLRVIVPTGRTLHIHGVKTVQHDTPFDLWQDTTTLFTEIRAGQQGKLVASGVLRLSWHGFLRQLTTFRATAPTARQRRDALGRFGAFFLGHLWEIYGRPAPRPASLPRWLRKAAAP